MKNLGEKNKETEEDKMPEHEQHPPFRWVSIWGIFHCKTGEFLRFLKRTVVSKLITDRHFFWGVLISNYRYRIELPEELISITETDLREFQHKISHYRYRFSLEFQLISITDTDFGLKTN